MNTSTNYRLKIADTPADDAPTGGDADPLPMVATTEAEDTKAPSPEVIPSAPPAPMKPPRLSLARTDRKRRGRRGSVERLPVDVIDDEIDRVNRMNGVGGGPSLAEGTEQDE
jgi:hypothetical protein